MSKNEKMVQEVYGKSTELLYMFNKGTFNGRDYCVIVRIPKSATEYKPVADWLKAWYSKQGKSETRIIRGLINLVGLYGIEFFGDIVFVDDLKALESYKRTQNFGIAFEEYVCGLRDKNAHASIEDDKLNKRDVKVGYRWDGNGKLTYRYCQLKASLYNASVNI